jgi:hypothetical protein
VSTMRPTAIAFATAVLLAAGAPAALAEPQDLRSPDAADATPTQHDVMPWQDLRAPDAQDAAFDATHRQGTSETTSGLDLRDAGVGAGAAVSAMLLAGGLAVIRAHRHPATRTPSGRTR